MNATPYWEKLKDPRWQKRRLEVFQAAGFECANCHASDQPLHAHHLRYKKGADPWDYNDRDIVCLCESCHEEWHAARDALNLFESGLTAEGLLRVAGYALGIASKTTCNPPHDIATTGLDGKGPPGILGPASGEWVKGLADAIAGLRNDSDDAAAWLVLDRLPGDRAQVSKQTILRHLYPSFHEDDGEPDKGPLEEPAEAAP